jgi:8-oxo-dGTP diphosphatase
MGKNEQGIIGDRYMLIPRILIFIWDGSKVLLLKGAPGKRLWANQYNGVGGHVERGESIHQAASRELFEETGLTATDLHLVGTLVVDASDRIGIGIYIFHGTFTGGQPVNSAEGSLEWVETNCLDRLPVVPDLKEIIHRISTMKSTDTPFSARSYYDAEDKLQVEIDRS